MLDTKMVAAVVKAIRAIAAQPTPDGRYHTISTGQLLAWADALDDPPHLTFTTDVDPGDESEYAPGL